MSLILTPNFNEPGKSYSRAFSPGDDFYEALIETHCDLSDVQSALLNARLVLLLSNHWRHQRAARSAEDRPRRRLRRRPR
jgi:hypothetical protein